MTISLLIPVHDYDIFAFVRSFMDAFDSIPELIEIVIGDDGSSEDYANKYRLLEDERVKVVRSVRNIGRSAIRNKLIESSTGDYLIFVDQDVVIPGTAEDYMENWISNLGDSLVVSGGLLYHQAPPRDPDKILRWKYGLSNEQLNASERNSHPYRLFSTFNVLFKRSVFEKLRFNEELKQYGYEDTLLAIQLKNAGIPILHIDNALYHGGLETNQEFLEKTKLGIENLDKLYDLVTDKKGFSDAVGVIAKYNRLRLIGFNHVLRWIYSRYHERIELSLNRSNPKIWLYDIYRLSMFCMYRYLSSRVKLYN